MDRRTFMALVSGGLLAAPLAAEAQQAAPYQPRQVGWLALVVQPPLRDEFRRGMRELGHVEGSTYSLHERYAGNRAEALPGLAAELTRLKLDVIVADATSAARAAQRTTAVTPIVFIAGDPVASGLVHSLSRPGGNLTGVTNLSQELYPKQVELLKEAVAGLRRLATLHSTVTDPAKISSTVREAAHASGVEALPVTFASRPEELERAFAGAARDRADAVLVAAHPFFNVHRDRIVSLALRHRLPALYDFRDFVEAGGLMCYGTDMKAIFHRLATYVDKILKGAKPADLPVEQPTKFELVINLKTAKALGLTIPQSLLLRADEVIQ